MNNGRPDPPQPSAGAGGETAGPASALEDPGASAARQPRKPRIEVLRDGPPAAPDPGLAQFSSERRIEALEAGAQASSRPVPPSGEARDPQPTAPPARRKRGGLLNSRIPMLAMLALIVLAALFGYTSSQRGADGESDRGDTEVAVKPESAEPAEATDATEATETTDATDVSQVPAEAERADGAPAAAEPGGERSAGERAPAERPYPTQPGEEAAAETGEPDAEAAAPADAPSAVATVRAFYGALSAGDGAAAAQWVVPAKRQSGPLSAGALDRYFSSFRRPLRVRRLASVDADTVRVAYDYVLADGRVCRGQATVDVVPSGDRTLVGRIRTQGPC